MISVSGKRNKHVQKTIHIDQIDSSNQIRLDRCFIRDTLTRSMASSINKSFFTIITVMVMLSHGLMVGLCHCSDSLFISGECPYCENCCTDSECDCGGKCNGGSREDQSSYLALELDEFVEGREIFAPRLVEFAQFVPVALSDYFFQANLPHLSGEENLLSGRSAYAPDATPPISGVVVLRRFSIALI